MLHAAAGDACKKYGGHRAARLARTPDRTGATKRADASRAVTSGNQALLRTAASKRDHGVRPSRAPILQRKCACGGEAVASGTCPECMEKRADALGRERESADASTRLEFSRMRSAAAQRCDADEDCSKDEPALRRGLLGAAICDENTGKVNPIVAKEHCKGNCVAQHEATHVTDMQGCCTVFADCIKNSTSVDARNACRQKWLTYSNAMENYSECNAYTVEDQCLAAQLKECGFPDQDPDVEACCQELFVQQTFVRQQMKRYCPGTPGICFM
jgi:hypothetical protein